MLRLMVMGSRIAAPGLLCAVLAACSVGGASGGEASCAASIRFAGGYYSGHAARVPAERLRESLTGAVQPACNDTTGADEKDQQIEVRRLDGVDPALAVSTGDVASVYVRDGADISLLPAWLGIMGQPSRKG